MFINGIAVFFYLYTIEGCSLNNIQKGNPILLLGHPHNLLSRCVVKIIYQLSLAEFRFVSNVVPALIRLKVCQNRIMLFYLRINLSLYSLKILHQTTTTIRLQMGEVLLYLLKILHQTTTWLILDDEERRCIYLKFYIKPQLWNGTGDFCLVVST